MVSIKNDPAKKINQVFVPKRHVDIVSDRTKVVADEDLLLIDIIRSNKEAATSVFIGVVLNFEEELSYSISIGADHVHVVEVEEVHTTALSEIPPLSGCGTSSSIVIVTDEVLNSNIAHDLAIL
jgi:mevalonate kinase